MFSIIKTFTSRPDFRAEISFEKGIKRTVDYILGHPSFKNWTLSLIIGVIILSIHSKHFPKSLIFKIGSRIFNKKFWCISKNPAVLKMSY